MNSFEGIEKRFRQLHDSRFKEYELNLIEQKKRSERKIGSKKEREKIQHEFMTAMGMDMKKLSGAIETENRMQEIDLQKFLKEGKSLIEKRVSKSTIDAKDAAIHSAILSESGNLVLPVYASSIFSADKSYLSSISGENFTEGQLNSGWVFPDDPTKIHIKDTMHYPNALCWENRLDSPPEFGAHFTFTPASTGNFEMTAVMAFHGFYMLRCNDSWWNCRNAGVRLKLQLQVHQYIDKPAKDFPIFDIENDNVDEIKNYDRTHFIYDTASLRAGDPVIVTVKGVVEAYAHGGGAYSELNFSDGTSNYIEPVLLSVRKV